MNQQNWVVSVPFIQDIECRPWVESAVVGPCCIDEVIHLTQHMYASERLVFDIMRRVNTLLDHDLLDAASETPYSDAGITPGAPNWVGLDRRVECMADVTDVSEIDSCDVTDCCVLDAVVDSTSMTR